MPLWHVFHPASTFDNYAAKAALARAITDAYASPRGLPKFYVGVYFHKIADDDIWIGGVPQSAPEGSGDESLPRPFIRLVGENIAVNMKDDLNRMDQFATRVTEHIRPHVPDKGYDWEFHIDETPTVLWRIQGLRPPPFGSEPFKVWKEQNKASPWEDEHATAQSLRT